jgi:long-chain acyl-CoA synthetase
MGFIGIYAKNRVEWLLTDYACTIFGLTSVPLYDTLGLENLTYCLKQTEMTTLFVSDGTLKILLGLKDFGNLKNVVVFDRIDQETVAKANKLGFTVIDFETLIQ